MAKNFIQNGSSITIAAIAATVSGNPVLIGSLKGIAANSADVGEDLTIDRTGVFEVTKEAGTSWAVGDKIYLKDSTTEFNKTATSNKLFGFATAAAASADTTGQICLADNLV